MHKTIFIIAITTLSLICCAQEQKPFHFVQLCDTQLGYGVEGYEHDMKMFKQAVVQINDLNPDFVVICGDLVHDSSDSSNSDFLKIQSGFKMPSYAASGNHDVGNVPNDSTLGYYRKTIGKDYYEFHNKGYSFIVTNTQLWKVDVETESEKHDAWFKETLEAQAKKQYPVFVVGHYPLYIESPEEEDNYFNIAGTKRKELLEAFEKNGVKAYLSGHYHQRIIHNYEGIQLVTGETTSRNFDGSPFGFRLWEVSRDTIKNDFIPLLIQ